MSTHEPSQPGPYQPGPPTAADPGRTLGIVGFILSFFTALIGMIISIVALRQSKKAGFKNGFALAGIIIGALGTLVYAIVIIVAVVAGVHVAQQCQQLGPGVHQVNGVTYNCG